MFWGQPIGKVILLLAGLLLVALAVIEFLGQPPEPAVAPHNPDLNPDPVLNIQARQPLTCWLQGQIPETAPAGEPQIRLHDLAGRHDHGGCSRRE